MCNGKYIRLRIEKRKQKLRHLGYVALGVFFIGSFLVTGTLDAQAESGQYTTKATLVEIKDGYFILETENGQIIDVVDPPEVTFEVTIQNGEIVKLD